MERGKMNLLDRLLRLFSRRMVRYDDGGVVEILPFGHSRRIPWDRVQKITLGIVDQVTFDEVFLQFASTDGDKIVVGETDDVFSDVLQFARARFDISGEQLPDRLDQVRQRGSHSVTVTFQNRTRKVDS